MKSLVERWCEFLGVVLDPWVVSLLVALAVMFAADLQVENAAASAVLSVLIVVSSAVLGARVVQQWALLNEEQVLTARGKAAVRGLKLLLSAIVDLEKQATSFRSNSVLSNTDPANNSKEYAEIIGRCRLLQDQVVDSIENWTDLVPEADIKTHLDLIAKLRGDLQEREAERTALEQRLRSTNDESAANREKLEEELQEKKKEVAELKRAVEKQRQTVLPSISPSSYGLDIMDFDPDALSIGVILKEPIIKVRTPDIGS